MENSVESVERFDMFGEHKSTLDAKGRMNIPAKLREELGERFFITKAVNKKARCLTVYTDEAWEALVEKLKNMPQTRPGDLRRFLYGSSHEAEPDKQGRVLIPVPLREYAKLESEIVIVGMNDKAEIWSREALDIYNDAVDMSELEDIAGEFGV